MGRETACRCLLVLKTWICNWVRKPFGDAVIYGCRTEVFGAWMNMKKMLLVEDTRAYLNETCERSNCS